jgi:glycosyltransferase involved in cell wall biosynthesis
MRALLVSPRFSPSTGGVESHVRELAARLPALGVDVAVLTTDPSGQLPTEESIDGVDVRRVRAWPPGRDWLAAPGLVGRIRAADADVVHIHSYQTFVAPLALAASLSSGRPTVLTFHSGGHSAGYRNAIRPIQTVALSPLLRRADALIAVSRFEAGVFAGRLRIPARRIQVIPNGSDLPAPSVGVRVEPGLIVSVGRLERYKGHERAVAALPALVERDPEAHLVLLGAGPDEATIRAAAARAGMTDRVAFESIPGADRQAYADRLASATCILALSDYEAQGIAAWEAAALGRPLVVTDATALGELVEVGAAIGVGLGDDGASIAEAIERAIAAGAPNPPAPMTWDACAAAVREVYRSVAD